MDAQIRMGSSMIVAGPSFSGKTWFILNFIAQSNKIFDIAPTSVFWIYKTETALHDAISQRNYNMIRGVPKNFDFIEANSIIVLDDLMLEAKKSEEVSNLFTQTAHHKPCFVIFVQQNLLYQSKESRTRHLNTQYLVLFKNPSDKLQIMHLQRMSYPKSENFLVKAFEEATREPFSYLFVDQHQKTSDLIRLRCRILPHEQSEMPMGVFVDRDLYRETAPVKIALFNDEPYFEGEDISLD